jgi:hypothetical protein
MLHVGHGDGGHLFLAKYRDDVTIGNGHVVVSSIGLHLGAQDVAIPTLE